MKPIGWFSNRRERRKEALDEELRVHLRMAEADRVARGESAHDAAAQARREFGNVNLVREITHAAWAGVWAERLAQDLRFGLRMLRRTPTVSSIAVFCLALGIGANAAVFSWMEGILLRPYPGVDAQDRLVAIAGTTKGTSTFSDVSWLDFQDLARGSTVFSSFIASKIVGATLGYGDRAERAIGLLVSANYFDALGVRPILGRGFLPGEDIGYDAHPVAVIGYRTWKDRFNGDPGIIGKTLLLNGVPHDIVGVTGPEFMGTFVGYSMQFWTPASMQGVFDTRGYQLDDRSARWIEGLARLAPGVSMAQAQAELSLVAKRLETDFPNADRGRGFRVLPLWDAPFDNAKELLPMLRIAFVVVVFVLLIACANVANLLIVRSFARRPEMTVRLALGAGRERLIRQLFTEGAILALIGTAAGLLCAFWWRHSLVLFFAPRGGVSLNFSTAFDWRVLALSCAVGLSSTLIFALLPAFRASDVDLADALKADSRGAAGGRGGSRLRGALVMVQVTLSFVLLVGAGLLLTSLNRIRNANPGFSEDGVLITTVNLFAARYDTARGKIFAAALLDRVRARPGVLAAAMARSTPFDTRPYDSAPIAVDGYESARDEQPTADFNAVSSDYFATMGIPIVRGREFTRADDDTTLAVAIVSETMAAKYWRGDDPVGKRLRSNGRWMQVVGVARDIRYNSVLRLAPPLFYVPLRQNFSTAFGLYIKTRESAATVGPVLTGDIHALDPNLAPYELLSMREQLDRSTSVQRVAVTLLTIFGTLGLVLAAIGLYGVMSYTVSLSTREFGLRLALGAAPSTLLRFVLARGLVLSGAGLLLGLGAAIGTTRLLDDLLYRTSPREPAAFMAASVLMTTASVVACFVPAWRAAGTDPATALRG